MNCSSCNQPLNEQATFCGNCGQRITINNASPQQTQAQSVIPLITVLPPQPVAPAQPIQQPIVSQQPNTQAIMAQSPLAQTQPGYDSSPPFAYGAPAREGGGKAIATLVLGICSIVFLILFFPLSFILGILAIIFGTITIKTKDKGLALTGIITGSLATVISILIFGFVIIAFDSSSSTASYGASYLFFIVESL